MDPDLLTGDVFSLEMAVPSLLKAPSSDEM